MRQNYKLPFFHPNHRQRNIILQLSIHYHGPMRSLSYSFFLSTTDWTDLCPMAIKEIKKFVAFPGLTPLQPDAYAQPRKRASLSDHPHLSGLPNGRRESIKTK